MRCSADWTSTGTSPLKASRASKTRGILNLFYPQFEALRANRGIRSGGMFNYIHRYYAGCDIWYFSNTTTADCECTVTLRSRHTLEEWNPTPAGIRRLQSEHDGGAHKSKTHAAKQNLCILGQRQQINKTSARAPNKSALRADV